MEESRNPNYALKNLTVITNAPQVQPRLAATARSDLTRSQPVLAEPGSLSLTLSPVVSRVTQRNRQRHAPTSGPCLAGLQPGSLRPDVRVARSRQPALGESTPGHCLSQRTPLSCSSKLSLPSDTSWPKDVVGVPWADALSAVRGALRRADAGRVVEHGPRGRARGRENSWRRFDEGLWLRCRLWKMQRHDAFKVHGGDRINSVVHRD